MPPVTATRADFTLSEPELGELNKLLEWYQTPPWHCSIP
jgi:hypothetical protein